MKQFLGVLVITAVAVSVVGCGSSSPTQPAPVTPVTPVTPVPATAALTISNVAPNPVPWTLRAPLPCLTTVLVNTWSYTLTIRETNNVAVTLTSYRDMPEFPLGGTFDPPISIPAGGSVTRFPNQCWQQGSGHTSQITYLGTDANGHQVSVAGPTVTLSPKP